MLPVIQRVLDLLTGSSPEQREGEEMADFYQRKLLENPNTSTGLPPPVHIQVEERQVSIGQFRADAPPEEQPAPDEPVLSPPPPGLTSVNPNVVTWEGGTTVTITGENFVSGATVKIGGIPATGVTFIDAAHISCVTPGPHAAGTVGVEVTNPSGQTSSLDNAIRYTELPDNFLLVGYQEIIGYQLCNGGYTYPYTLTARLGTTPFNPSPSTPFFARLLLVGYGNLCIIIGGDNSGRFYPGNANTPIQFTSSTGHTINYLTAAAAKADNSPGSLGPNGYMDHSVYLSTTYNQIGGQVGLYGDSIFQPNFYHIVINPSAPPPSGIPPSTDYFLWIDVGRPVHESPWNWVSGSFHTLKIQCIHPTGTLATGYNGTANLSVSNLSPGNGTLNVSTGISSINFVSGEATLGVTANFSLPPGPQQQGYGYFNILARDTVNGAIQGTTPTCSVLNHL